MSKTILWRPSFQRAFVISVIPISVLLIENFDFVEIVFQIFRVFVVQVFPDFLKSTSKPLLFF